LHWRLQWRVDGACERIGRAGGDFGEFLLALAEYEHMTKRSFSQMEVQKILTAWLDWVPRGQRPLYFHTDETATQHLQANLHYNGKKGTVVGLDLDAPKDEYRDELLKDLALSKNQACTMAIPLPRPDAFDCRSDRDSLPSPLPLLAVH
jgi:hypothetical protein